MAEEYSGTAYCVKCKEKRDFTGEVSVNAKGTRMAKGKCPVCGTTVTRIRGKAGVQAGRFVKRLLALRSPGRLIRCRTSHDQRSWLQIRSLSGPQTAPFGWRRRLRTYFAIDKMPTQF